MKLQVPAGNVDSTWFVDPSVLEMAVISSGVAVSWFDRTVEYTPCEINLRVHHIPQLNQLTAKEIIPLPNGEPMTS
jgi:hypothetical protein